MLRLLSSRIVRVKNQPFFGEHAFSIGKSAVRVTDREKTIVDCLNRPDLSGGVREVAWALREGDGELDWGRTAEHLRRFGSGAVAKRLGSLVESVELAHPPGPEILDRSRRCRTRHRHSPRMHRHAAGAVRLRLS